MPETLAASPASSPRAPAWLERPAAWLKARERTILLVGAGFQLVMLLAMIVVRAAPLVTGDGVLLRVAPGAAGDAFRGNCLRLGYEFSRIPDEGIVGLDPRGDSDRDWQGRTVYVTLVPEPDGLHYRAEKFSLSPPPSGTKHIRGRIAGSNRIEYGIESYYVQEGEGRKYEQPMRTRRLSAEVSIAPDGQAALKGLHIE